MSTNKNHDVAGAPAVDPATSAAGDLAGVVAKIDPRRAYSTVKGKIDAFGAATLEGDDTAKATH
jgi:hypothetical protein